MPPLPGDATLEDYRDFFTQTNNRVALQTIESSLSKAVNDDHYG